MPLQHAGLCDCFCSHQEPVSTGAICWAPATMLALATCWSFIIYVHCATRRYTVIMSTSSQQAVPLPTRNCRCVCTVHPPSASLALAATAIFRPHRPSAGAAFSPRPPGLPSSASQSAPFSRPPPCPSPVSSPARPVDDFFLPAVQLLYSSSLFSFSLTIGPLLVHGALIIQIVAVQRWVVVFTRNQNLCLDPGSMPPCKPKAIPAPQSQILLGTRRHAN